MTEDEIYAILTAKGRSSLIADPAICRIASHHISAFLSELTRDQTTVVLNAASRFVAEIEWVEQVRAAQISQRMAYRQPEPKKKAFDKFINFITLDWLV